MFVIAADQTEGQFITVQGEVDDALETTLVIIAKLCLQTAFEFSGGRIGDYIDCAAGGIAAKQGALRSTQNLGALRSEEHTSELQSLMRLSYAVLCLKKKNKAIIHIQ